MAKGAGWKGSEQDDRNDASNRRHRLCRRDLRCGAGNLGAGVGLDGMAIGAEGLSCAVCGSVLLVGLVAG